jgi:hypothetical protein
MDLRRRLAGTRWPERETVEDSSQGVQFVRFQELVRYWETDYDRRKAEAKLNIRQVSGFFHKVTRRRGKE